MQEKRVKCGLALTPDHLKLCDQNLSRAGANSRNCFVEKAIEFYSGYLNAIQNPGFFNEMFTSEAQKKIDKLTFTLGTGQYKIAVELATLSCLLADYVELSASELRDIHNRCAREVKELGSVPGFGQLGKFH